MAPLFISLSASYQLYMCTSAAAFEEVLSFSKWKECDFLLLGGDVFHDNKVNKRHFCLLFCMSFVLKFLNY